ncbi:hypothetical protein [Nostoc sp. NMS9]|uniref:hypothetical protein n=1 Tax=Nostoc sp. NMS9 TaxID=2815393 RepID=UPI0025DC8F15|nr:hypothetical protein [Nostoc sp. NMS9]MBN3942999.1 hypothetical protein [Nostoc sp. NMS9]
MKKQTIYIALALSTDNNALVAMCWHIDKSRAGDVGTALTQQKGLAFFGVTSCENADFEADSGFPDEHWLNKKQS